MVPKPFPYPLGIGVDVCQVNRVARYLRTESLRNRWARKIFTRLEWRDLCEQFRSTSRAIDKQEGPSEGIDWMSKRRVFPNEVNNSSRMDDSMWMLPKLAFYPVGTAESEKDYIDGLASSRSPISRLARHLAGRWAAKEAVIKAHSHRQLYMHDVSIIRPDRHPKMFPAGATKLGKSVALIEPPSHNVVIDERVAEIRGLRGFGPRSRHLQPGALLVDREQDLEVTYSSKVDGVNGLRGELGKIRSFERRSKVDESERQIAEVNISHDGNTAVAVCMALDQPESHFELERTIDDGTGLPIHEPQWGDEGWFLPDKVVKDMKPDSRIKPGSEDYNKAMQSFLDTSKRKIPFLP